MNQTCFALFLFFRLFRRRLPPLIAHLAPSPSTVLCTSLVQLDFFFSCIHTRLRLLLRSGLHFTRHLVAIIVRNNDLTVSVLFFFFAFSVSVFVCFFFEPSPSQNFVGRKKNRQNQNNFLFFNIRSYCLQADVTQIEKCRLREIRYTHSRSRAHFPP